MMIVGDRVAVLIVYCIKVYKYFIGLQIGEIIKELALNDGSLSGDISKLISNLSCILLYSGVFIFLLHKNEIEEKVTAENEG